LRKATIKTFEKLLAQLAEIDLKLAQLNKMLASTGAHPRYADRPEKIRARLKSALIEPLQKDRLVLIKRRGQHLAKLAKRRKATAARKPAEPNP
jgi:hypothetical protein